MPTAHEIEALRQRLLYDTPFWASQCAWIVTGDGGHKRAVRLVARPWQARTPETPKGVIPLDEALERQRTAGMPMRAIILKARKLGFSTWAQAKAMQRVTQLPFQNALTVAHRGDAAGDLFDMANLMYERLPSDPMLADLIYGENTLNGAPFSVRPQLISSGVSPGGVRFLELGSKMRRAEKSIYRTLTAGSKGGGRAGTPNIIHASEFGHYEDPQYGVGLFNAMPLAPETIGIVESTANAFNHFHAMWQRAVNGAEDDEMGGVWAPLFYGWQHNPYNSLRFVSDRGRERFENSLGDTTAGGDAEEIELLEAFGVTLEQLNWRRAIINGPEGGGDVEWFHQEHPACLTAEMRVSTELGIVPISEAQAAFETESGLIKRWGPQPASQIFKLTTKQGRVLRGTFDHPVQTEHGLVGLSALGVGTRVDLRPPRFAQSLHVESWRGHMGAETSVPVTPDLGRWIGYFMGDGSWGAGTIDFALDAQDQDVVADVRRLTCSFFGKSPAARDIARVQGRKGYTNLRLGCKPAQDTLARLGLIQRHGDEKWRRKVGVPDCIWRSPREVVREFLRALFECDGSASGGCVRFASSKVDFARDVQLLLLGFGFNAVMSSQTKPSGNGAPYWVYSLQLGGDAARKFHDEIGFISERKQAGRPEKPSGNGRPCVGLQMWDEVASVEPDGLEVTYDFTMDTNEHLFMAQGILTHNTPEQAFIGSGRPVFPGILVARAIREAQEARPAVEGVLRGVDWREKRTRAGTVRVPQRVLWVPGDMVEPEDLKVWSGAERLLVWQHPLNDVTQSGLAAEKRKPDGQYVVFADSATGAGGTASEGDWHAVQVIDHLTRKQVARYRSRIPVHELPLLLYMIASYWNMAWLAPEANGPGQGVIDALKADYQYPLLYRRHRAGDDERQDSREFLVGWLTTGPSKFLMEQTFGTALADGTHGIRDVATAREASTYVQDQKNAAKHGAQKGAHDDLLISIMGAHRIAAELTPRRAGKKKPRGWNPHDDVTGW